MEDICDEDSGSGPISRSSVTHVASAVAKFSEEKKELVREIGFGGILELPHITKVDRKFTLWLLTKINLDNKTIIVNGEPVVDFIDFEANRIMGIPCGTKKVCPLASDDRKVKLRFIQNFIGSPDIDNNSLTAAESIVTAQYDPSFAMTDKDKQKFKVSFVVWVMGHLLAPTKKHNVGSDKFWGALLVPDEIKDFNWSAYVIDELINAARDVQDAIMNNKNVNTITGCSILLQIIYFESINMGSLNRPRGILPRVKVYDGKSLSLMIAADKACSSSGSANATWGSNVRNFAQEDDEPLVSGFDTTTNHVESSPAHEDTIIKDLGKYVREKFGDKVTRAQSIALNWFHARCLMHYNQLRLNVQQDTITLVGKLFNSQNVLAPGITSEAPISNYIAPRPAHSEPSRTILKNKRSHTSSFSTWKQRQNKKNHVSFQRYELPETLLTGVSKYREREAADQQSDSGNHCGKSDSRNTSRQSESGKQSTTPLENSGFTIDTPSFDLGIDFESVRDDPPCSQGPMNPVPCAQVASQSSDASGGMNSRMDLPEGSPANNSQIVTVSSQCSDASGGFNLAIELPELSAVDKIETTNESFAATSTPACSKSLCVTPPTRKSMTQPEFATPEQNFINCRTSPASLSKILAEGDLVDRMTHSDDSPNLNIKPWDEGYSDAPIDKRIVGIPKMPESPWMNNLCHRIPPTDIVEKLFQDVAQSNESILNRPWLAHTSPRHIEVDGIWIRNSFIGQSGLSYDTCDLAIRRLKQLDDIMYSNSHSVHWRHFFESELAILAVAGEIPYDRNAIIEQFIGHDMQYRLEDCRMIVVPAYILLNWCCYFFDFKEKRVHVIDPLYNTDRKVVFNQIHPPNVSKIAVSLNKCFEVFFDNWHPNLHGWDVNYVQPPIVDATSDETGLLTLMYMRQFDGANFHDVDREYFCHFKKVMLYELMSLNENAAKPPFNVTITIDD